ncbi:acetate and sugar kinases/Hsc70/actin family protein [Acinetobacter johnsonii]|uniref:Molecular chaperone DnaK n=1 Tax=Acinetobacter johnsonii TaxID=40214 RepID=A0A427UK45_ACIJO|nr:hypothetical protein [Acinetobacter johnsonii]RSE18141.1 hypothetical protein EGT73_16605 [Acinetobacter johnsonii]
MSQSFETFVPTLKHQKLLATVEAIALEKDKVEDTITLKQATEDAVKYFEQYRYWSIDNAGIIFDRKTGLLWQEKKTVNNATEMKQLNLLGLQDWKFPTQGDVKTIVEDNNNHWRKNQNSYYLLGSSIIQLSENQAMWLDRDYPSTHNNTGYLILAINLYLKGKSTLQILKTFNKRKWDYKPYNVNAAVEISILHKNANIINQLSEKTYNYKPELSIAQVWQNIDYISSRLPKIDALKFTDVEQGMWEFFVPKALQGKYKKVQSKQFCRDRNPVLDIREANVAIDFGTSSTVVAIRKNGKDELLRIGMQEKDFAKDVITDQQYENPTVLEFLDLQNFLNEWQSESYRPLVDWDNIHCSHEARAALRNNNSNTKVVSSIFARLKQWALRNEQTAKVRLRDQQEYEYQLQPLTEYNPVKGQPIQIGKDYPQLDPIEVYAWFLGMTINWRERGIFLNYYLTFPVKYSNEVKARILAAFRRGLQRSLPESLIYDERFNEFSVEELASEPAAFAAAALERLEIEPDDGGVSYAVFDFGGGTTDFDYGFYRNPNDDEHDEGWDHVIEHFGSSGDQFLGGENLLENLAYLVFQANSSECNKKKIAFTKPLDAEVFAGSELLIAQTQAAYTNTTLMMSKLRPLWEAGKIDLDSKGTETFKLINKDGQTVDCEIAIKQDELIKFLENRIRQGLRDFFIAMNVAFKQQHQKLPELIHILLAGNSSRSRMVLGLLGRLDDEKSKALHQLLLADLAEIFEELPDLEIHLPLDADPKNAYAPTAKTGVALGLLRLCPGETLKVVNHAAEDNTDSPFQYFIGAFRRDTLQVAIHRGQTYQEWAELGKPLNGVLVMGYTTSSSAALENQVKRGDKGVFEQNLRLSGNVQGHKVFAKVLSPNEIEICTAQSLDDVHRQQTNNNRIIQLSI